MVRRLPWLVLPVLLLGTPGCTTVATWRWADRRGNGLPLEKGVGEVRAWRDGWRWIVEAAGEAGPHRTVWGPDWRDRRDRTDGEVVNALPPGLRSVHVQVARRAPDGGTFTVRLRDGAETTTLQVGQVRYNPTRVPIVVAVLLTPLAAALDLVSFPISIPVGVVLLAFPIGC